jgi:hypothetical protein
MAITGHPLHRPRRAALPHRVPASRQTVPEAQHGRARLRTCPVHSTLAVAQCRSRPTQRSACGACGSFRSASRLPSSPSAAHHRALFETFFGTMRLYDFPGPYISGVRPQPSRCAPSDSVRTGEPGISRVAREMVPCMLMVCDPGESLSISRYRWAGCGLPHEGTASALPTWVLSGLNTSPARAPTNASHPALRLTTHSSGPVWIATPSPYDSLIRSISPPYLGAVPLYPAGGPKRRCPRTAGGAPRWEAPLPSPHGCRTSQR